MSKLVKILGRYFLGTDAHDFYQRYRNFYIEYITDPERFEFYTKHSKIVEGIEITLRIIPTIGELGSLIYSFVTQEPMIIPVNFLLCEGFRSAGYLSCKKIFREMHKDIKVRTKREQKTLEKLSKKEDEKFKGWEDYEDGDGWKNPSSQE